MPAQGAGHTAGTPEKLLNGFVRVVALIERVGNALGTLAFTWATVVLLGGYPTVLLLGDFWFATAIVFLEASRMFSRNNRLDYQLFFDTIGAFKPLGWNGLILVVIFTSVMVFLSCYSLRVLGMSPMMASLCALAAGRFMLQGRLLISNQLRRAISLWSPFIPILFLGLTVLHVNTHHEGYGTSKSVAFLLLFVVVFLLMISRLRFPRISKLVDRALGSKQVLWHRVILNSCMLATGVMLVFIRGDGIYHLGITTFEVYAVAIVSLGNLQIPAATMRVVLALLRLISHDYGDDDKGDDGGKINLAPSLNIFYGMVLGQGILYSTACILELFSFFPRRSLARRCGFGGRWGVESVNLYYAYAFEKYIQGDVLAPKNISLNNFVVDSLNSDTPKMQLHGVRVMHSLLQKQPTTRRWFILKLNTSMETMARLTKMLDWTSPEDTTVRLFAAKVTAELATSIRVVTIPGTIQVVSALLDYGNQQKRGYPLLETNVEHEKICDSVLNIDENLEERLNHTVTDSAGSLLEAQDRSTEQVGTDEQKSWIFKCCQRISKFWSIPQEEPLTEQDLLPVLAMLTLDGLASCDQGNCVEISRASGLIPKVIAFTSCRTSGTTYTEAQRKVLVKSFLKLLHRLTSVEGDICFSLQALEIILVADGAELEIFIGLGSQICKVIPEDFIRELENGHIEDRFVKRLIDALNGSMEPSPHCPGIRRVILEQAINMMEHDSRYINCFIDRRMAEALSVVEETASEAENYSLFLGDVGLMEAREPLSSLVARAKQLLAIR